MVPLRNRVLKYGTPKPRAWSLATAPVVEAKAAKALPMAPQRHLHGKARPLGPNPKGPNKLGNLKRDPRTLPRTFWTLLRRYLDA